MWAIMFPEAPAPTLPITQVEDTDLDCLLIEFPNHLVIPKVMEHFCAPRDGGSTESGYNARKMAERLSVHANIENGLDFDAKDRIGNLVAWIRKLKKAANAARRKRLAAGQSADLVPFEGQRVDPNAGQEEGADVQEESDGEGAPTALGLRLKQRADQAIAERAAMMDAKQKGKVDL